MGQPRFTDARQARQQRDLRMARGAFEKVAQHRDLDGAALKGGEVTARQHVPAGAGAGFAFERTDGKRAGETGDGHRGKVVAPAHGVRR